MITLQQVQELRDRVDSLRLNLLSLKDENAVLKDEVEVGCERIKELERQLFERSANDENVDNAMRGLLEELGRECPLPQEAGMACQSEPQQDYATSE